jgi:hypothetical protein
MGLVAKLRHRLRYALAPSDELEYWYNETIRLVGRVESIEQENETLKRRLRALGDCDA